MRKRTLLRGFLAFVTLLALAFAGLGLADHLHDRDAVVENTARGIERDSRAHDALATAVRNLGYGRERILEAASGNQFPWSLLRPERADLTRRYLAAADVYANALRQFALAEAEIDAVLDTLGKLRQGETIMVSTDRNAPDAIALDALDHAARSCGKTSLRLEILAAAAERYREAVAELGPGLRGCGLYAPDPKAGEARMEALLRGEWARKRAERAAELFGISRREDADLAQVNDDIRVELERIAAEYRSQHPGT
jgi:hypothetical protein